MKKDDFVAGDRICTPVLSDTIDNVCFAEKHWVSGQAYPKGDTIVHLGIAYISLVPTAGAVAPAASADWSKEGIGEAKCLPCIIYAAGAGDVKFTTYNGDVDTLAITAGGLLASGSIRVRRVWAGGTTAAGIRAIAEG